MRKTTSRISACAWTRRARRIALVRRAFLCAHQLSQIGRYLNRGLGSYWHACYAWTRLLPGSSLHHNRLHVSQGVDRCSHLSRCAQPASRSRLEEALVGKKCVTQGSYWWAPHQ